MDQKLVLPMPTARKLEIKPAETPQPAVSEIGPLDPAKLPKPLPKLSAFTPLSKKDSFRVGCYGSVPEFQKK